MIPMWVWLLGYASAWFATMIFYVRNQVEDCARVSLERIQKWHPINEHDRDNRVARDIAKEGLISPEQRLDALFYGAFAGSLWPLFWVLSAATYAADKITSTSRVERDWRQAAAERAELAALRRQAHDLNLPMPDADAHRTGTENT